ncbi:MAG: MlaD family protein [Chthoniobacterales bacterium]
MSDPKKIEKQDEPVEKTSREVRDGHAVVVKKRTPRISWAWFFPVLALAATAWLFYQQWQARGPEIVISFKDAPGMEPGKTNLIFRGVEAGRVTGVDLDDRLDRVAVTVRLKAFAEGLAREGTKFWIDQPVISLEGTSGLDSLIQGNSIRAQAGTGPYCWKFQALESAPVFDSGVVQGNLIRLYADPLPPIIRGAPVYYRGMLVGRVDRPTVADGEQPFIQVVLESSHANLVNSATSFWVNPAGSISAGPGGIKISLSGINALVQGSIAFDDFGHPGEALKDISSFALFRNESAARASGEPFEIQFDDGHTILPEVTQICYLGVPIGLVVATKPEIESGTLRVTARLYPNYENLLVDGTSFTLVRPEISLQGVTGLDTLISGAYIELNRLLDAGEEKAGPAAVRQFLGDTSTSEIWQENLKAKRGQRFYINAKKLPPLEKGAPIIYRGLQVGRIEGSDFTKEGSPRLQAVIWKKYADLLTSKTRFWRVPATDISVGAGNVQLELFGFKSLLEGGVAFESFEGAEPLPDEVGEGASLKSYPYFASKSAARATSKSIEIVFETARGLVAGQSELRYLGQPVGMVESVDVQKSRVVVLGRFYPGYEFLCGEGSRFSLIHPTISLQGITGLDTLLGGIYIDCAPSFAKQYASKFTGIVINNRQQAVAEEAGFTVYLTSSSTTVKPGAPVLYRDLQIGVISEKVLSNDGSKVILTAEIESHYAPLVRKNSRFWNAGGLTATLGFMKFRIRTDDLMASVGRVQFSTPGGHDMAAVVEAGHTFELHKGPKHSWLRWDEALPLDDLENDKQR